MLAGTYEVKLSLQGFKEYVRTDVPVTVNTVSRVDAALDLGELSETVTVRSESQLLQTDKADTHTEFQTEEITQLPLVQNRNYQSLMNLVPGAMPTRLQNAEIDTPGRALSTQVNGLDRQTTATKTDGATNVNIWLPHHTMYVSPAETIDTVNVSTSNFDAEQGNAGGAAITVITKSGTNEFKGSAFAFYNNQNFNARPYFATEKPEASSHIDGATVGGADSAKDKLFFFGAWEGQYQRTPQQFFSSVPPTALRAGDFSQAFNPDGSLQIIYDPRTGNPDGTGRLPFPANVIPEDRIGEIARQVQDLYPQPNLPGELSNGNVGGAGIYRNYVRQRNRTFDRNNYDFKINYNLSSAAQVWGKYSRMGADVTWPQAYLGYDSALTGETTVQMYTFSNTWTINPRMVFDATLGISKMIHTSEDSDITLGNFGREDARHSGHERWAQLRQRPTLRWDPVLLDGQLLVQLRCHRQRQRVGSGGARRAHIYVRGQPDQAHGRARVAVWVLRQPAADGSLAARAGVRPARLHGSGAERHGAQRRQPGCQHLQRARVVPAGLDGRGGDERPVRAHDHARMAAQHVRARPVAGEQQAHARHRSPLRVLPAHDAG